MDVFADYLAQLQQEQQRVRISEVLEWVKYQFQSLEPKLAWNQPMFTDHGTFIIGFSAAKQHMAVSPERRGILRFSPDIAKAGYAQSKMLFRIKWEEPVDYPLLEKMIEFNRLDKAECKTFWRKESGG